MLCKERSFFQGGAFNLYGKSFIKLNPHARLSRAVFNPNQKKRKKENKSEEKVRKEKKRKNERKLRNERNERKER